MSEEKLLFLRLRVIMFWINYTCNNGCTESNQSTLVNDLRPINRKWSEVTAAEDTIYYSVCK